MNIKNINPSKTPKIMFISLFFLTITNKAFFQNAATKSEIFPNITIKDVEPSTIKNIYNINCGDCQASLHVHKKKRSKKNKNICKFILILNKITCSNFNNQLEKITPKKPTNIEFLFSACKYPNKEMEKINSFAENMEQIEIFNEPYKCKSIYKAKMLLYKYFLEESDFWENNNRDKEKYRDELETIISKIEIKFLALELEERILNTKPILIASRANQKYRDIKIICN